MSDRARSRISVDDEDGRHVAAADIEVVDPSEVRASLQVESGHLPVGTRTRLVDAVLLKGVSAQVRTAVVTAS